MSANSSVSATTVRRRRGVPPLVKLAAAVTVLVGIGLLVKVIVSPGPPARCEFDCSAPPRKVVIPGHDPSFVSPRYGFTFSYPAGGQRVGVNGAGVVGLRYQDGSGRILALGIVSAGAGDLPPAGLITDEAQSLSSSEIADLQPDGTMHGAEIGFTPGSGEFYTGNYTQPDGEVDPVELGIVAVQHRDDWYELVGMSVTSGSSATPPFFGIFDDILDNWRWSG